MDKSTTTEKTVYSFPIDQNCVDILQLQYSAGGECYEYRIFQNGLPLHTSENCYETPNIAANDGFKWITYNL